jgi:fatty-acyl-CoA synthase
MTDSSGSSPLAAWRRALESTARIDLDEFRTFPEVIDELGSRFADGIALIDDRGSMTFRTLAERVNQYARWTLRQKIGHGEVVAVAMHNCADYFALWLGVTKVGATAALINTNLTGAPLAHAIRIASPKHLISDAKFSHAVLEIAAELPADLTRWCYDGNSTGFRSIEEECGTLCRTSLRPDEFTKPSLRDRALLIYTSGTTGLPKAANVSHHRVMQWTHWFAGLMGVTPSDRLYNCLPMYHSIGGIVAIGAPLVGGASVVIRPHFSAQKFWPEIAAWRCTIFQYIGELCRYLLSTQPHPLETSHILRLCCGNGLGPDIWDSFKERFSIPRILEFYASTEGTFSLYNCEEEPGSIGRVPPFLSHRSGVALVQFDIEAGTPIRDDNGHCLPCPTGEVGEALGEIPHGGKSRRFEGYVDGRATEQKILRNVFVEGDAWFRTGDLMRRDSRGFYYFIDRIGDTYRWKGENVSSQEVAQVASAFPGVIEAVAFGVTVPACDGRAGMLAIVADENLCLRSLREHLAVQLASYARPYFLRICTSIASTSTFRPRKADLIREGFDPAAVSDPLFFNDDRIKAFVILDTALHQRIASGGLRL